MLEEARAPESVAAEAAGAADETVAAAEIAQADEVAAVAVEHARRRGTSRAVAVAPHACRARSTRWRHCSGVGAEGAGARERVLWSICARGNAVSRYR